MSGTIFNYLIYGVKLTYSDYFNNIIDEDSVSISEGFDLLDNNLYVTIDENNGNYVYIGNIINKNDDFDIKYKNANPLTKKQIEMKLDKLFGSFVVRPILYQSYQHYY